MARIVQNDKGFKVIALSHEESRALGFGIDNTGICICSHCNRYIVSAPPTDIPTVDAIENEVVSDIYYIAVLNDVMDEECYNKWYNNAKYYSDDRFIENHNFERVKGAIEMEYLIRCTNVGLI